MGTHTIFVENLHLKEMNAVQCGYEKCAPSHDFGPTFRTHYLLHYVEKGKGVFVANNTTYTINKGDIFIIHPNETTYYKADDEDPWSYIWMGFESTLSLPLELEQYVIYQSRAHEIFTKVRNLEHMDAGREYMLLALVYELFAHLKKRQNQEDYQKERAIKQAIAYMDTEYYDPLSVSLLAKNLHLDRSYFFTLFKHFTGVSPKQYLTNVRMKKAVELLTTYGFTVSQTASSIGYPDISSFCRMFKRFYHVSPSIYVEQHTSKEG